MIGRRTSKELHLIFILLLPQQAHSFVAHRTHRAQTFPPLPFEFAFSSFPSPFHFLKPFPRDFAKIENCFAVSFLFSNFFVARRTSTECLFSKSRFQSLVFELPVWVLEVVYAADPFQSPSNLLRVSFEFIKQIPRDFVKSDQCFVSLLFDEFFLYIALLPCSCFPFSGSPVRVCFPVPVFEFRKQFSKRSPSSSLKDPEVVLEAVP